MRKAPQSPSQVRKISAFLVRLYGFFFVIASVGTAVALHSVNDLLANATRVNGQVVAIDYGAKGARAPVVKFQTASGETLQLKSLLHTSSAPNVGDTVKVVYRTSNPQDWQIDDWIHLYFYTLIGSIFMFVWAMATIIVKFTSAYQLRNLERAGCIRTG